MSKVIAAYGGGFKPPTKGHFEVVEKALNDSPEIDEFIIYVGGGERGGINQAQSILIWEIYQSYLPMKVKVEPSKAPIGDIIRLGKNNLQDEVYFVIGAREGFEDDMKDIESRTKNIEEKYPNMKIKVITTPDKGISGTNARKASQVSYDDFIKYIPSELSDSEKEEVYNIVKPPIDENGKSSPYGSGYKKLNENASYQKDINLIERLAQLTQHMLDKGMNIEPLPNLEFVNGDSGNARDFLGKTAYYNPNNQTIVLYTEGRHPKDITRSYAHEMIHHIQNLESRLGNITTTNTQEDDHLNNIEAEANLKGTMTFRNWTDTLTENQMSMSDFNLIGDVLRDKTKSKQIHNLLIQMFPEQKELLDYNYKNDSYAEFKRFIFNIDKSKLEGPISINHTDLKLDPQVMKDREKKYQDYIDGKADKYFRDTNSDPRKLDLSKMPPITIDSNGEVMDGNHRAFLAIKQQKPLKGYKIVDATNTHPNVEKILQIVGKKDITPSYKYKRGGLYGKMYNETVTDTDINLYPFKITDKTYDEEDNSLITTEYKFITPNNTYRVEFYSGEYNPEVKTFDLSFGVDKGELNTIDTFQMTGEGNARKIFKTILNITKDFINKEDVNKIVVDGTDEKRKRIYKTIFSSTPPEISDKIELKEAILNETVTDTDIICDNCGWSWKIVDGGDDLFICHKCGHDNSPLNEVKPYKHKHGFNDKLGKDPFGLNQFAREIAEEVINEGRYDKLTNQLSSIVFKKFKGIHDRDDKSDTFELSVGPDDEDILSDQFEFDLIGSVEITDDEYEVDGGANAGFDDEGSEITPLLSVKFRIPKNPNWQKISFDIKDVIRHELEHLTQDGENVRQGKQMGDDQLVRNLIDAGMLSKSQYFKLEKEVDAMLQGLYFKAKKSKQPFKDVINNYLNIFVDQEIITQEEKEDVLNIWRSRGKALSLPVFENEEGMKYKIYSDMDGVLTDFDKSFEKYSGGIPPREFERKFGKDKFWEVIDEKGKVGFWVGMPWMEDGKQYWDYIKDYDTELLSSPSRSSTSRLGKRLWVKNNMPGVKLTLAQAAKKQNYAAPNHILIDDRKSNIDQWRSQGGIGILHTSAADTISQLKKLGL